MVLAIARQVRDFEMPGTGIEGFGAHARAIARAGIYDLAIHHDQILMPVVLHHWRLEQLEGLNAEAEAAREKLVRRMQRIRHAARVYAERRGEAAALVG
jgi:acyl-[acyl-carrier-protein] desaturase